MKNLVEDLKADNTVSESVRGQLQSIYDEMDANTEPLGHGDMSVIAGALAAVATTKGEQSHY